MDRKFSVAIATLMVAAAAGCNRQEPLPQTGTAAAPAPAIVAPAAAVSAADQAQVDALAFIVAIDEQEVAAAEQARGKKIDASIRAYADLLHQEHSSNLDQTHALADAARLLLKDGADVMAYRSRGQADLERMAALDADEYAEAYLTAISDDHAEALALIDERLLRAATRPELRQHLLATRSQVEQHLQAANALHAQHPARPKPRPKAAPAPVSKSAAAPPVVEPPVVEPAVAQPPAPAPASETDVPAGKR